MSESVQLASLQPPRSGHANRAAHDGKGPGGGFDKALDEIDGRHAPSRDAGTVSGKPARRDNADDEFNEGRAGGEAAFFARLFSLGDKPADPKSIAENAPGKVLTFDIGTPSPKKADEQKTEGDETTVPVLVAASAGLPAMPRTGSEPEANGTKVPAKGNPAPDNAVQMPLKGEAPLADAKAKATAKAANAAADAAREPRAANTGPQAGRGDPHGPEENHLAKVKVVSAQSAPAPVSAHLPSPTATALARAIHTGMGSGTSAAHAAVAAAQQQPAPVAVHTLNIQLRPEALGTVTARLHLSGDNLRVDLQVDNADAHHRLKADSDVIVKSLRALGYDVDRVTIQAPAPSQPATSGQNAASQGRDQSFQQAQGNSANGQGSGHAGGGRENGERAAHQAMERHEQRSSGGGLYI